MTGRPRHGAADRAAGLAAAIAAAAVIGWWPHAPAGSLIAAGVSAFAGASWGSRAADSRVRTPWLVLLPLLAAALALRLGSTAALLPVPFVSPEAASAVRDLLLVASLTLGAAFAFGALVARHPAARPVVPALLVLAVARLVAAHRGGSIHRPHAVADPAWLHGWHPVTAFAGLGLAAAFAGALALRSRWRRGLRDAAVLLAVAAVLLHLAPRIGLVFSVADPLGLGGSRPGDEAPAAGGKPERGRDRLGLTARGDSVRSGQDEMAPFRDEYPREGEQAPVAVVTLHDDVEPMGGVFYFRQVAFSVWNGRRLVRSSARGVDVDLFRRFPYLHRIDAAPPPPSPLRREVPTTVSLIREHAQPPVLVQGTWIAPAPVPDRTLFRTSYRASSAVLTGSASELLGRRPGDPRWPERVRRIYLELPPDRRYRDLARRTAEALRPEYRRDPWALASGVALWLERNTRYSLRSHHASAADPTASFLFGDRIGYCVHLAHAAAYLMRALGLPSRVAAGYAYVAENRAGGSAILLRSGDAHAWAEVYLDGVGWVPIDPAPPSLDPPMPAPDLDLQRMLGELARGDSGGVPPAAAQRRSGARAWAAVLLAAIAALFAAGQAVKIWRRLAPFWARRDRAARTAYRAALDRLAEAGWRRGWGETRESFARRVAAAAPAFERLTSLHLRARLGTAPADGRLAARLSREVGRQLARRGLRGRILGVLDPFSWLRSR
ncbi:MAG: transglutaminase domain-containing protein [Acidobacteria bacterium]|nr:MAG: transglutaminase domain-containing protein [Acidobacteriota bacterium]